MITIRRDVQYLLIAYNRYSHKTTNYGPFVSATEAMEWANKNLTIADAETIRCEKLFYPLSNEQK